MADVELLFPVSMSNDGTDFINHHSAKTMLHRLLNLVPPFAGRSACAWAVSPPFVDMDMFAVHTLLYVSTILASGQAAMSPPSRRGSSSASTTPPLGSTAYTGLGGMDNSDPSCVFEGSDGSISGTSYDGNGKVIGWAVEGVFDLVEQLDDADYPFVDPIVPVSYPLPCDDSILIICFVRYAGVEQPTFS